jgi:hypothetical protein
MHGFLNLKKKSNSIVYQELEGERGGIVELNGYIYIFILSNITLENYNVLFLQSNYIIINHNVIFTKKIITM